MDPQENGNPVDLGSVDIFTGEADSTLPSVDTPQVEDSPVPETSVPETKENDTQNQKKYEQAHKLNIDTIEDLFNDLEEGILTKEQVQAKFEKRPELAIIADRSKRVKETYRAFMKDLNADVKAETVNSIDADNIDQIVDERIEAKLQERLMRQEDTSRTKTAEDYATKNNFKDEEYKSLVNNANALKTANPSWSYTDSLKSAHSILRPQSRSLNLPAGFSATAPNTEAPIDLTQWTQVI